MKQPASGKSNRNRRKPSTPRGTLAAAAKTIKPIDLKIRRIMAPVDFSTNSRQALRHAIAFAAHYKATLVLLHVVEPVVYPADLGFPPMTLQTTAVDFQDAAKARLQMLVEEELPEGIPLETRIKVGRPYQEICDTAAKEKIDLLIVSTHGYTGLKHVLLGSTAERVVRHAPCPVLVVRRRGKQT
jgi:nucleotide-binding universal stress UspA family protein